MTARPESVLRGVSATRPYVDAFADAMEAQLDNNREKGDRAGWAQETPDWLLSRLIAEVGELATAMADGHSQGEIVSECADIANFAMMVADVAGGMKPVRTTR